LEAHAEFLHHVPRGRVLRYGDGDDALEARLLEAVAQARGGRLGRIALPPELFGEAVADFRLARIFQRLQAAPADHLAGRLADDRRHAVAVTLLAFEIEAEPAFDHLRRLHRRAADVARHFLVCAK